MIKRIVFLLFLIATFAVGAHAQVINAASCSATDVQTALNSVVASTTKLYYPLRHLYLDRSGYFHPAVNIQNLTISGRGQRQLPHILQRRHHHHR